jgi:carbonic anhydrase/SulP family sulfate permease
MTPAQVLQVLREGNQRFRTGQTLTRDFHRQVLATASGQHPLAVVLSCIDSRTPVELVLDLGLGDVFSVRIAGNVARSKEFGSMEYGCAIAGAKLILVMGHTQCGAVTTAVHLACSSENITQATGCRHLEPIMEEIQQSIDKPLCEKMERLSPEDQKRFVNEVAERNVLRVVERVVQESPTLERLVRQNRLAVVGAMYDVATGEIRFLADKAIGLKASELQHERIVQTV